MPELPEVEEAAQRLRLAAVGHTVIALRALHPSQRKQLPARRARRAIGRRIVAVERRGKYQSVRFDDDSTLLVHFRMDGDWHFGPCGDPPARFARAVLDLENDTRLSLVDARALCTITWHESGVDPLPALGPEADDPAITATALRNALAARRGPIKAVLLDQRVLAGLGNIYAAESLWRASIHPAASAAALREPTLQRLITAIRASLADGVRNAARYRTGVRVAPLKVYDREGEPCTRCGATIRRITQAGRSTYYCAGCQRLKR